MKTLTNCRTLRRILVGAAVGCLTLMACGSVSPADAAEPSEWKVDVGAGVGFAPDYEGSEDYELVPQLYARAQREHFFVELDNFTLRANVVPHPVLKAGPVLRYRPERDDVENNRVDRLRDVDAAFEIGGFVGIQVQKWDASVTVVQDVADGHDGLLLTLGAGYTRPLVDRLIFRFAVFSNYANSDYMDSYFSIDANNAARSGLPTFSADDGFKDLGVRVRLRYQMVEHWGLMGTVGYVRLLGDAEDSPIVDDEGSADQFTGGVVVIYTF